MPPPEEEPAPATPPENDDGLTAEERSARISALVELERTPISSFSTEVSVGTARELFLQLQNAPLCEQQWAFRGHSHADWTLEPSIERLKKLHEKGFRTDAEEYVRRTFKRRAHKYLDVVPIDEDELEWLALMRHYGAPTRLLDWTTSPYVAAFFATADAEQEAPSAIWAIDARAVKWEAAKILREAGTIEGQETAGVSFSDPRVFNPVFMGNGTPAIVAPVQPFRTHERMVSQQGLFLCPNSLHFGFELGLKNVLKRERVSEYFDDEFGQGDVHVPERLFKLVISPGARSEILRELHRMNITYATLFPGLDGFARSLATIVTISEPWSILSGEDVDVRI
jgi:hypothetical protein